MDYRIIWILVAVLVMIIIFLLLRMNLYKKQIRSFTHQLQFFRKERTDGLINVDSFGRDYIALAKELQQFVDDEQKFIEQSEEDRQSVKNMVAGISHDFRTPLTSAMGYMQLVQKDKTLSEENAENLKKAFEKTKYLKELSDEFFALSLMENRAAKEFTKISLRNLFENITLEQYEWIQKSEIKFSSEVTENPCMINASEVDMTRLFMNLYSNAKKYAKGQISTCLKKENDRIIISIENDLEKEVSIDVSKVFEPFHREYVGDKGGNGLGLYITKRIVENYGGTITAEKTDDKFICIVSL